MIIEYRKMREEERLKEDQRWFLIDSKILETLEDAKNEQGAIDHLALLIAQEGLTDLESIGYRVSHDFLKEYLEEYQRYHELKTLI
jgi:hypothetical protein